jgi:hypothetical protein
MGAVFQIERAIVRLSCTACGAEANASCDCGKPYVAMEKARAAVIANPEKSDRAIAAEIGVSHPTVAKARRETTGNDLPVDERVGLDGRVRKLPQRAPRDFYAIPDDVEPSAKDYENSLLMRADHARELAELPFEGRATNEIVDAVRAAAAAWERLAQQLEQS